MSNQALDGVRVLDIGHYIAGPYCAKLFADFGAAVIKLEKPDGGDNARRVGPFPQDKPDIEKSGLFFYLNNNKKGITLNLKSDTGVKLFKELVKETDILIENFSPRVMPGLGLDYDSLKAVNPGLVMVSITNFGQSGPYRDYKGTDITLQALGGWLRRRGDPNREPLRVAGSLSPTGYIGGAFAAAGAIMAVTHKIRTGIGQHLDIPIMETVHHMIPFPVAMTTFPRMPSVGGPSRGQRIPGIEECKDGIIGINMLTGAQWQNLCILMNMADWADDPDYSIATARSLRRQEVRERMHLWLMERTKEEVFIEGQELRVPTAMVYSTEEILKSPQYLAREYFVEVEHQALGNVTQPGAPFKMTETPWQIKSPAPLLGQHNEEIYGKMLGYSEEDLIRLRRDGII